VANVLAGRGRIPCAAAGAAGMLVFDPIRTAAGRQQAGVPMKAMPGDRLIIDGDSDRVGDVIGVPHADGAGNPR